MIPTQAIKVKPMMIHGKWYDMSGFEHPGGPVMLKCGECRDATALFEAHHPFTNRKYLETLLSRYEVDPTEVECALLDPADKTPDYDWPEYESKSASDVQAPVSDFAHELRQKVHSYLKQESERRGVSIIDASKTTPYRRFELGVLALLFLLTIPSFFRGEWWTLLATPLTYWLLGVNILHDGSHFALSRDWRVNHLATYIGWWFSSPLAWYHQHVIGHHAYTNIPNRDPDLYHNATMERHTKTLRHRPAHRHQHWTWPPIWFIGTFAMSFIKPLQLMLTGRYNRSVALTKYSNARIAQHFLGRVLVFLLSHVLPFYLFDPVKAFCFSTFPVMFVSMCFMISSQMNHLNHECVDVSDRDYYRHQVITSHSFMDDGLTGYLTFIFTGGLNCQIEHHLFPTINHCHLPRLRRIVKAVCKKHDVNYPESSGLAEAMGKYIEHMKELSVP